MKQHAIKLALGLTSLAALSGCATSSLIHKDSKPVVTTQTITLVEDSVLAFGKPSLKLPNLPNDAVVIVGQKHSYVLTQGGGRFQTLLTRLDPRHITLTKPLKFYSANNDGSFTGELAFKYTKLQSEVGKDEINFFLQNGVTECTNSSDRTLGAQSFCFKIDLAGLSYPAVANQSSLQALSQAYPVSIYTTKEEVSYRHGKNAAQKLVLFPFAVAFDVVTLPFQALGKILDD